MLAFGRT